MANSFRNEFYRSPKTLSYIVIGLFASLILCAVAFVGLSLVMVAFPDATIDLGDEGTMHVGFGLIGLVSLLELFLRIGTVVFFLIWLHRAYSNLSPLRARNLEYTPGWAVGWWFIPFANLVKPYQVMSELYDASDPSFDPELNYLQVSPGTPATIGFWWGTFLAGNFVWRITDKLVDNAGNVSQYFPVGVAIASALTIVSGGLIILIVRDITQREEARYAKIAAADNFAPPSPAAYFSPNA
jgi:hypothetical protein